jgi:hypothetical protein
MGLAILKLETSIAGLLFSKQFFGTLKLLESKKSKPKLMLWEKMERLTNSLQQVT